VDLLRKWSVKQFYSSILNFIQKVLNSLSFSLFAVFILFYSCDPPNTVTPEHIPTGITTIPFKLYSNGVDNFYCIFNGSPQNGFVYVTIQYLDVDGKMSQWGEAQKYSAYELTGNNARIKVPGNVRFGISCTYKSTCDMCCDDLNPDGCPKDIDGFRQYGKPTYQGRGGFYNRLPPNASMYGSVYGIVMSFSGCVDCGCL
jgi:hypothetical protein